MNSSICKRTVRASHQLSNRPLGVGLALFSSSSAAVPAFPSVPLILGEGHGPGALLLAVMENSKATVESNCCCGCVWQRKQSMVLPAMCLLV